ncbi:hypothetical protein CDAR_42101 [Caerostris darwini]|uniref:Uncharacterized protein n=1 Tax=Caerostris darwini TaxID=1538125 RepID=A0AAV4RH61_9ARAC|nr:hypothetical protein CDAR_42101 [Caerostris darwini]
MRVGIFGSVSSLWGGSNTNRGSKSCCHCNLEREPSAILFCELLLSFYPSRSQWNYFPASRIIVPISGLDSLFSVPYHLSGFCLAEVLQLNSRFTQSLKLKKKNQ